MLKHEPGDDHDGLLSRWWCDSAFIKAGGVDASDQRELGSDLAQVAVVRSLAAESIESVEPGAMLIFFTSTSTVPAWAELEQLIRV